MFVLRTRAEKDAYKRWKKKCEEIQSLSNVDENETKEAQLLRIRKVRTDYNSFVQYYFQHYCKDRKTEKLIPCAKFHIQTANKILRDGNIRAVFKWARGHAKSTHMDIFIPLWLMCQQERQINVMVLVGKNNENANVLLSDIQAELQYNKRYIHDFGEKYNSGSWQNGEFVTKDGIAFFARGRGQSPRGLRYRDNRPDYIVIDDLDDDELCENEERVHKLTDWVKEALFGSFGADGGRFIMVGNLISKNSVLANIAKTEGVQVSQVNAYDKNGNPSWAEYWTKERIEDRRKFMGYRAFEKEYMNNPITEGAVFKNDWIHWKKLLPLQKYNHIVAYCDPSFKSSAHNDYKAIKVWGKIGTELHNIKNFVRQCSVAEMVRWFYDLHESLPSDVICDYYMEANFMQDIILDEFSVEGNLRGYQLPIRPDNRKKPDKFQRIEAISPLWERGFVFYNEKLSNDRDTLTGLEQLLAFEKGSHTHDDAPDADEGAIYILQKRTRLENFTPRIGVRTFPKHAW
jgi:predicted phage terminase large subunit-like protein